MTEIMVSKRPSKEVIERMYHEYGMSHYQISCKFDTTPAEVNNWMIEYDMIMPWAKIPRPNKQDLESMYTYKCMDQEEIGEQFGVHRVTVGRWLNCDNIATRGTGTLKVEMPSKSELEQMWNNDGMSQEEIGDHFGVHQNTACNWLKHYEIQCIVPMPPKSDLEKLINEGLDQHQIAESYGVCDGTIFRWCERLGIPGMVNGYRCYTPEHQNWRRNVFQRDHYTCQKCGATKTYIQAHHIVPHYDHPELEYELDNGITLCKECHLDINGREYNYIQQFAAITQPHFRDHDIIESMPWEPPLETNSIIDY